MKLTQLKVYLKKTWVRFWLIFLGVGAVCGALAGPSDVIAVLKDPLGRKAARQAAEDRRLAEGERRRAEQESRHARLERRLAQEERSRAGKRHRELAKMVSEGRAGLLEKYPAGYVVLYTDGRRVHEDRSNSGATILIEPHTAKIRSITDEAVSLDFQIRQGGLRLNHENTTFPRRIGAKHDFHGIGSAAVTAEVIAVYGGDIAVVIGARDN